MRRAKIIPPEIGDGLLVSLRGKAVPRLPGITSSFLPNPGVACLIIDAVACNLDEPIALAYELVELLLVIRRRKSMTRLPLSTDHDLIG